MSSVHSRKQIFPLVWKSLPLFSLLFLGGLLFLAGVLLFSKMELQNYCSREVHNRLEKYLQEKSAGNLMLKGERRKSGGLHGLSFVRLSSADEQFFYAEDPTLKAHFKGLIPLDPSSSAVWIALDDASGSGSWTITSTSLENGLVVQAGMEFSEIHDLYHRLCVVTVVAAGVLFLLCFWLVYLCNKKGREPLRQAERSLAKIVKHDRKNLLQINKNDDLAGLYELLNKLIVQNRQLIKEMQESLDNVAHDLRTPMTRLRSIAEYGLKQNTRETLAEALSDCLEESERVLSMLTIMLSVVEAESGTLSLNKTLIQLCGTVVDVVNLYEYVADEKDIRLTMDIDPGLHILADKTRITQVWANIVDNALKYGRAGGYVKISAKNDEERVTVFFEDDGMGISVSEKDRIWERLFRGDRSRTQQGLGLGLNYVRAVVEAHGGQVTVHSKLGEGSCFELQLPRNHGEL